MHDPILLDLPLSLSFKLEGVAIQHPTAYRGRAVLLRFGVKDTDTGRQVVINHYRALRSNESFVEAIRKGVMEFADHEFREAAKRAGSLIYNPHRIGLAWGKWKHTDPAFQKVD